MTAIIKRQRIFPYGNAKYRSLLEARYAAFLSTLRVPFVYEPMRLKLTAHSGYTPDYWCPEQQCYLEIKGTWHDGTPDKSLYLAARLAKWSQCDVFIAFGNFPQAQENADERWNLLRVPANWQAGDPVPALNYAWTICMACGSPYIYSYSEPECAFCRCGHGDDLWSVGGSALYELKHAYYVGNRKW